jgi:hypothetical protein
MANFTDVSVCLEDAYLIQFREVFRPRCAQTAFNLGCKILCGRDKRQLHIQIPVSKWPQKLLLGKLVQARQIHRTAGDGIYGPPHYDDHLIVMPVTERVVAFAVRLTVLSIGELRRVQAVRC